METETGVFGRSAPAKSVQQGAAAPSQRGSSEDKVEQRNDECSVFISNLAYTLPEPEAQLRRLFEACGPLQNIRPVFSNKGSFKGYCYVQFESAASVPAALKLDRTQVEGRPMFVSPCVDKNRNPNFKVRNFISYCVLLSQVIMFNYFIINAVNIGDFSRQMVFNVFECFLSL